MGMLALLLDVVIAGLLSVTIGYCWLLNRRIQVLQNSKSELAQLLRHFDESTQRASESIIALQTASKKIGENIQMRIDKANFMLDDLTFMIEKGDKIASQMEAGFAVGRARAKVLAEPPETQPEPVEAESREKLMTHREKTSASLEAVLERVGVGRANKPLAANDVREERSQSRERKEPRARSRAEQELLDMIKAGIRG